MTVADQRCDVCGRTLAGLGRLDAGDPGWGRRFSYHPGDPAMRDDSGVLCGRCWPEWTAGFGEPRSRVCARCGAAVTRRTSLHLRAAGTVGQAWQLCTPHAADQLNALRTVVPKFDRDSFRLPLDTAGTGGRESEDGDD